jgi:nucleoside-diphosphate-sugar epimerase
MKVFVTGGTGYIGIKLVSRLVEMDHEVVSLIPHGTSGIESSEADLVKGHTG